MTANTIGASTTHTWPGVQEFEAFYHEHLKEVLTSLLKEAEKAHAEQERWVKR